MPHPSQSAEVGADIVERLRTGDARALEALFRQWYVKLCRFAERYLDDRAAAEDLVQDLSLHCGPGELLDERERDARFQLNSGRLRSYKRVDARWTRYFDTRRGRVSVFGEVHNLFDSVNARGMWTQLQVRGRGVLVVTGERTQWPRLPLAGLSWEFLIRRKRPGQWGLRECRLEIYLGRPKYSDPRYKGYSRPAHAPSSNVCNSARPPA